MVTVYGKTSKRTRIDADFRIPNRMAGNRRIHIDWVIF